MNEFAPFGPSFDDTPDLAAPAAPGDIVDGKYEVTRVLGAGGMGVVVEARHLLLDRPIAIKFMSPLLAGNEAGVRRFMLEARAAAQIQCEHVARVFDVATSSSGAPYIVMEYLEGRDLEHLLRERRRLPVDEAVGYLLQACEAIAEAHAAGIVHRDLKPANLFVASRADGSPLVKVLDFGVSKLLPTARGNRRDIVSTGPHVIIGSPLYSSPEQLRAVSAVDARSDVWSLGAILYEMIGGEPPFPADTFLAACTLISHRPYPPLRKRYPEVPPGLDAVIAMTLTKEPERRTQSVAELARGLARFAPARSATVLERIVNVDRRRSERGAVGNTLPSSQLPPASPPPESDVILDAQRTRTAGMLALGAGSATLMVGIMVFAWLALSGRRGGESITAPVVEQAQATASVATAAESAPPPAAPRASAIAVTELAPHTTAESPPVTPPPTAESRPPAPTPLHAPVAPGPRNRSGHLPNTSGFGGMQ
jgi:serine/threonine-protein kinase